MTCFFIAAGSARRYSSRTYAKGTRWSSRFVPARKVRRRSTSKFAEQQRRQLADLAYPPTPATLLSDADIRDLRGGRGIVVEVAVADVDCRLGRDSGSLETREQKIGRRLR